jgi:hypothetical protein
MADAESRHRQLRGDEGAHPADCARRASCRFGRIQGLVYLDGVVCQGAVRRKPRAVADHRREGALDELAQITGRAKSNLSRTLKTMEGYGLIRLERGERGRIMPKVAHDRVELDRPLTWSKDAAHKREVV